MVSSEESGGREVGGRRHQGLEGKRGAELRDEHTSLDTAYKILLHM